MIFMAFSRIHVNSIKMNACGGCGGGGIGFSLKRPRLSIDFSKSNNVQIECQNKKLKQIIKNYVTTFIKRYQVPGCKIKVLEFFEPHRGLGSETQAGLLIGKAFNKIYNLNIEKEEIVKLFKIAGVSGIGYYSFFEGGFIVEGGYPMGKNCKKIDFNVHSSEPPVFISRYNFPKEMKILLIIPNKSPVDSFSRIKENTLFKENTPISLKEIGDISTSVLTGLIPGIITKNYNQIVKNLMFISTLGTKRLELKINFDLIKDIQKKMSDLIEFKYYHKERNTFSLVNDENQEITSFVEGDEEILIKKPIPWLGLSSLGSTLYSVLNINDKKQNNLIKEISKRIKDVKIIITEVKNGKSSF